MIEQSLLLKISSPEVTENIKSRLRQEYQINQQLFQAQSSLVKQFLSVQAALLAEAVLRNLSQVRFNLPEAVTYSTSTDGYKEVEKVPVVDCEQAVSRKLAKLAHPDLCKAVCQRLAELEWSPNQAVSVSGMLIRYSIAINMIYHMLPAGRSVTYIAVDGDEIPSQPVERNIDLSSAINSSLNMKDSVEQIEEGRGELQVPYAESARHFYLPQWVAFDCSGKLLLDSLSEAEAFIASMQNYLAILNSALVIAPYMITDVVCQQKRYGMLGQLVNQGRAFAHNQSQEIIRTIQRRLAEHKLDRGLRLSLPYFDDQKLLIESLNFIVVPAGRIMFVPAFAVLAAREQQARVAKNNLLSFATRKHLLAELHDLEIAFSQ